MNNLVVIRDFMYSMNKGMVKNFFLQGLLGTGNWEGGFFLNLKPDEQLSGSRKRVLHTF
jgi:hypothetical protein